MIFGRGIKNKIIGNSGEDAACEYIKKQGYKIVSRNTVNKLGEIDIIAQNRGCLVFIEVKTRTSDKFGTPAEAVTYYKKQKIIKTAEVYLMQNPTDLDIRFDVIEVYGFYADAVFYAEKINHIPGAFEAY